MKISKVVLASMVSASFLTSCKNNLESKKTSKAQINKINQDSLTKIDSSVYNGNNCPACGMG